MNQLNENGGVLFIDKPYNWTSFDVVAKIRSLFKKIFGQKIKVGHTGTLDPLATGLLILCLGKETKNISTYLNYDKQYITTFDISATTPSYDMETEVIKTFDYNHLSNEIFINAISSFVGEYNQIPPIYSAKKIKGKRAYELAHHGKNAKLAPQKVTIYSIELIHIQLPLITIKVHCSKGTYIRSLVHDIGLKTTGGAYITNLRRTAIGPYSIEQALTIDQVEEMLKKIKNET